MVARKPFTSGPSTCCDMRSGLQWPKCQTVSSGKDDDARDPQAEADEGEDGGGVGHAPLHELRGRSRRRRSGSRG